MATNLHNVRRNFEFHIGALTPTNTKSKEKFTLIDPLKKVDEDVRGSGSVREFYVQRLVSTEDMGATDRSNREAWHHFVLVIFYPLIFPYADLHDMVDQDRHDLCELLRGQDARAGYSAAQSTTAVGLVNRYRIRDEVVMSEDDPDAPWELHMEWLCHVRETE